MTLVRAASSSDELNVYTARLTGTEPVLFPFLFLFLFFIFFFRLLHMVHGLVTLRCPGPMRMDSI